MDDESSRPWLIDLPELAGLVGHELNNALNSIVLQIAVAERRGAGESVAAELEGIRNRANAAAAIVQQLQNFIQKRQPALQPLDLNSAIQAFVSLHHAARVHLELASELPLVLATPIDMERLLTLLLCNAAAAAPEDAPVVIKTERLDERVQLSVIDSGPTVEPAALPRLFEPFHIARPGADGISLVVCKGIARRFRGSLQGRNREGGGMVFVVELRSAPPASGA